MICGAGAAGDVNNDGYDDFIAGSHYYNNGETGEGIALLWLGSENGLDPDSSRPIGNPTNADWMAESNQETAYLGFEFGESGDLNNDGFDDVLVSASLFDITGTVPITNAGAAFIWFGSELGLGENGTPSNADWVAEGDQVGAYLGWSLDWAGDVNDDGLVDVIAGAPYYDDGENNEGRAYVYYWQNPITGLNATNDSPTILGEVTTLSATITSGSLVSYTWDLGDVSFSLGETISHTYAETGVYTAVVTATNEIYTMTDTTTVVIVDEAITGLNAVNDSPTTLGDTTTLTATINTGSNVSYNWDFGDDSMMGTERVETHIYEAVGVYTATVTASNSVTEIPVLATTTVSIISLERYIYLPLIVNRSP